MAFQPNLDKIKTVTSSIYLPKSVPKFLRDAIKNSVKSKMLSALPWANLCHLAKYMIIFYDSLDK